MRVPTAYLICLALCLVSSGCRGAPETSEPAPHAAAKTAPVSPDDWCAEHQVPESQCTACNPGRSAKPPVDGAASAADQPPPNGLKVRLESPAIARIAGIATEKGSAAAGDEFFVVPARLAYDASRRAEVNARRAGVVRSVLVDIGNRVRPGDPLVVIDSPDVGADRSRLAAARTRVDIVSAHVDRQRALHADGIAPKRDLQEAEGELAAVQAEVQALEAAAGTVGAGGVSGRYTLHAPLAGSVVRRAATVGRQVDPEEVLLEIVDASTLWAEIDVPEPRLGEIGVGNAVTLTFDGLAGRGFQGTIASIAPEVDPRTRTAVARVRLTNADGALRANMYGRARIATGEVASGVRVPRAAVQRARGAEFVFVRLSDTLFETRHVDTAARLDGWVDVTRGLVPGEEVVTAGSFLLKTETIAGSIGAGCCDVE